MIQLTLTNDDGDGLGVSQAPFFRITGAAVWTVPGESYIARLRDGVWDSHGRVWTGMRFEGPCRLVMGFPREPTAVSEILQSVSVTRDVLSANGVPFAVYNATHDMWRAVVADKWWHAFRIQGTEDQTSLSGSDEEHPESGPKGPSGASEASSRHGTPLQ